MTKAEAVEYVKVCTEFGEGFFYIPGTDTCLKISGEVRANYRFFDRDSRQTDVTAFSTEPRLKFDARTATEYGTLRSYIQVNMPVSAGSGSLNWNLDKAFIQFGGLTAGYAHTFFGIYDADYGNTIFAGYYSSQSTVNLLAYTAVFGGGFSATLSVEDGRDHRGGIVAISGGGAAVETIYGGQSMPDIVGQLRLDGAWGEAAVFGAVHQTRYPDLPVVGYVPEMPTMASRWVQASATTCPSWPVRTSPWKRPTLTGLPTISEIRRVPLTSSMVLQLPSIRMAARAGRSPVSSASTSRRSST